MLACSLLATLLSVIAMFHRGVGADSVCSLSAGIHVCFHFLRMLAQVCVVCCYHGKIESIFNQLCQIMHASRLIFMPNFLCIYTLMYTCTWCVCVCVCLSVCVVCPDRTDLFFPYVRHHSHLALTRFTNLGVKT